MRNDGVAVIRTVVRLRRRKMPGGAGERPGCVAIGFERLCWGRNALLAARLRGGIADDEHALWASVPVVHGFRIVGHGGLLAAGERERKKETGAGKRE